MPAKKVNKAKKVTPITIAKRRKISRKSPPPQQPQNEVVILLRKTGTDGSKQHLI
jgi:hypothetical protein